MSERISDEKLNDFIEFCEVSARENDCEPSDVFGWDMAADLRDARTRIAELEKHLAFNIEAKEAK